MEIAYGKCHCGCDKNTNLARATVPELGWVRGEPLKFLMNHDKRAIPEIVEAAPFKIDGVYCRLIPLTKGLHAIVDEADYLWLMRIKWQAVAASDGSGYYVRGDARDGRGTVKMHRFILGAKAGKHGDHWNGCGIDNRRNNLRGGSERDNAANRKTRKDSSTGFKGAYPNGWGRFKANIMTPTGRKYLGTRDTAEEAARLYDAEAKIVFGPFARLNFPNE